MKCLAVQQDGMLQAHSALQLYITAHLEELLTQQVYILLHNPTLSLNEKKKKHSTS